MVAVWTNLSETLNSFLTKVTFCLPTGKVLKVPVVLYLQHHLMLTIFCMILFSSSDKCIVVVLKVLIFTLMT